MNKKKVVAKAFFDATVEMFSGVLLWTLIWGGAVIALADHGELFLAILLILSGAAWVYRESKRDKFAKGRVSE